MVVVLSISGLVAEAGIKGLGFPKRGITPPDAIARTTRPARRRPAPRRLGQQGGNKQERKRQEQMTETAHEAIEAGECKSGVYRMPWTVKLR